MNSVQGFLRLDRSPIPAPVRVGLLTVAGLMGGLVLIAISVIVFFDINAYRLNIQAAASAALGMEVSVDGSLGIGFSPGLYITLSYVRVRNLGIGVATTREASFGIDILPLVSGDFRINRIWLEEPIISLDRDQDGNLNFNNPGGVPRTLAGFEVQRISINGATIRFFDQQSELRLEASDCDIEARDVQVTNGESVDFLKRLSFSAELGCGTFRKNAFAGTDLKISAIASQGSWELEPVTMDLFGAQGVGKAHVDFGGHNPRYVLDYTLPGLQTEAFFTMLSGEQLLSGPMDFTTRLEMEGDTYQEVVGSASGDFSLRAGQLELTGSDLDNQLDEFESSQHLNLVDVGAFFFVGPLGLLATKGYDFASLLRVQEGKSTIRILESAWRVEHGVAEATDVAMTTERHRIALQGRLDFANEQFEGITLALVDDSGCAQVRQRVSGPFQKPVIDKPGVIRSLSGPIRSLVKSGADLFVNGSCEVFYAGRVPPPVG